MIDSIINVKEANAITRVKKKNNKNSMFNHHLTDCFYNKNPQIPSFVVSI